LHQTPEQIKEDGVEVQIEGGHLTITFENYKKEVSTDEGIEKIQRGIPPYIKRKYSIQKDPQKRKKGKKQT
jgi:hypothetical protein